MNNSAVVDATSGALVILFRTLILDFAGAPAQRPMVGKLSWVDLGSVLGVLVLALLISTLLAAIGRRQRARAVSAPTAGTAPAGASGHHAAAAMIRPAQVFIWGYALYLCVGAVLPRIAPAGAVEIFQSLVDMIARAGSFIVLVWLIYRLTQVLESRLVAWATHAQTRLDDLVLPLLGRSLRVMVVVLGAILALPILDLPERYATFVSRGTSVLFIGAVAVILFQAVRVGEQELLRRYDIKATDNLRARKVYTQVRVIGRVIDVAIGLFTLASILMLFAEVRQLGASVLASAGVVGIIAGIAAQKTIGNLFAGFQIAMAQPMREDDVVVVEGEWGRIEEITLTYVVIHIWDDRRLVVPLSYFIEKPFANWTRTSSQIMGQVTLWVDYGFPVEEARAVLKEIIEGSRLWDRRFWNLQVVDSSEKSIQLRILATSADSSTSWDLRCEIREKFIARIRSRWPDTLPQLRLQPGAFGPAVRNSE
ncbi:MAG TPA: mechanosensitive ion channel domain-containing protein [Steroidobacteraceae bacterium]|jgi:small-conductance mechanosensitive channel